MIGKELHALHTFFTCQVCDKKYTMSVLHTIYDISSHSGYNILPFFFRDIVYTLHSSHKNFLVCKHCFRKGIIYNQ